MEGLGLKPGAPFLASSGATAAFEAPRLRAWTLRGRRKAQGLCGLVLLPSSLKSQHVVLWYIELVAIFLLSVNSQNIVPEPNHWCFLYCLRQN